MEVGVPVVTVSAVVLLVVPSVPVSVTGFSAVTAVVVTLKVAVVAPPGTMTLAGTVTEVSELESVTTVPPVGAAESRVTVPVAAPPPTTLVGVTLTEASVGAVTGAVTVSEAD